MLAVLSYALLAPTLFHTVTSSPLSPSLSGFKVDIRAIKQGSTPALPIQNAINWVTPVAIGGQTLNLWMDTGSSDLWVFDSSLAASDAAGKTTFNTSASPTFNATNQTWSIIYIGEMGASGYKGSDDVTVAGFTVKNQTVEVATQIIRPELMNGYDGVLGLGSRASNVGKDGFFANLRPSLEQPVFTFNLKNSSDGTMEFGYIDADQYSGDLLKVPVLSSGEWNVGAVTFSANGTTISSAPQSMSMDTGGMVISFDESTANAYYAKLDPSIKYNTTTGPWSIGKRWILPCGTLMPDLTVHFNTSTPVEAIIPGEILTATSWPQGDGTCLGSVWGFPSGWIGAPFFLQHYVVFNTVGPSISFALKK